MKKNLLQIIFLFVVSVGLYLYASQEVEAYLISPVLIDKEYEAGQVYTGTFKVFFRGEDNDVLYLYTDSLDFEDVSSSQFSPKLDPNENTLANWITFDRESVSKPEGDLDDGENYTEVGYTITVPNDAPPKGHYAVIVVAETPEEGSGESSQVSVGIELALQLYAIVPGEEEYDASLEYFKIKDDQKLFGHLPTEFETLFRNDGNVHIIPRGNIEIFKKGEKEATIALNPSQKRVFPGKSRLYENIWSEEGIEEMEDGEEIMKTKEDLPETFFEHVIYEAKNFRFGKYTARLQGHHGPQPPYDKSVEFWVIPWHLITVVVGAVGVLIVVGRLTKGGKKKEKKESGGKKK